MSTPRGEVLTEANMLIHGDRDKSYGSPTQNFTNIAKIWNVLLGHKLTEPIEAREVADLVIAVKLARGVVEAKRDNYVDIAGYAACGWEVANPNVETPHENFLDPKVTADGYYVAPDGEVFNTVEEYDDYVNHVNWWIKQESI